MRSALLLLATLSLAAAGAARAQTTSPDPGYRIGPKDLLRIVVYEVPELNVERRVGENGLVNLPLVGDFQAAGLTADELALRLQQLLESKYLQTGRASANVEVREFLSAPIAVLGAVNRPGPLAFPGRSTLLEAITQAGGLAPAHGGRIHVLRRAANGLSDQVVIDADALMVRADPKVNIPIYANDLISVPAAVEVTVYCLGEVANPGAITFRSTERVTLLAAIARAGGLGERAASRILIKRAAPAGVSGSSPGTSKAGELFVDYKRILAGKDPDVPLEPSDIVVVKESFF